MKKDKLREILCRVYNQGDYDREPYGESNGIDIDEGIKRVKQFALEEYVPKEKLRFLTKDKIIEQMSWIDGRKACREEMIKNIRGE